MINTPRYLVGAVAAAFLLLAPACGPAPDMAPIGAQPAPGAAAQADLWATSTAAYEGGVTSGRFALERTQNPELRTYAQRLVDDYGAAGQRLSGLFTRYNMQAQAGEGARRLQDTHTRAGEALRGYEGADFDRQWLDYQIATHRWMLDSIDRSYMPAARGRADLEAELRTTRTSIQRNLQEAERLRGTIR
jgi:putative membrane protein